MTTTEIDDYMADALTRAALLDGDDSYPMAARCDERGHHRFMEVMRHHCADCGIANSSWVF